MGKFKAGVTRYEEEFAEKERQRVLHEKHNISEEILIVEKSNIFKFLVRVLIGGLKLCATISIICLASVGLIGLIYPETREAYVAIYEQIMSQLEAFC